MNKHDADKDNDVLTDISWLYRSLYNKKLHILKLQYKIFARVYTLHLQGIERRVNWLNNISSQIKQGKQKDVNQFYKNEFKLIFVKVLFLALYLCIMQYNFVTD